MINLQDHTLIIPGGTGKLGRTIINEIGGSFGEVLVGYNSARPEGEKSYKIGEFKNLDLDKEILLLITCAPRGVEKVLSETPGVSTIIASTGYDNDMLNSYNDRSLLCSPNLSVPIVEISKIIDELDSFEGIIVKGDESHPSGKIDYSGTFKQIFEIISEKGGKISIDAEKYNPDAGISRLGSINTYRRRASENFNVPPEFMDGHAYHKYYVSLDLTGVDEDNKMDVMRRFWILKNKVINWSNKYSSQDSQDLQVGYRDGYKPDSFEFWHYVNGRKIYADNFPEISQWFLNQDVGTYTMIDYIKSLGQNN